MESSETRPLFFRLTPCSVTASMWYLWKSPWLPEGSPVAWAHIMRPMVLADCRKPVGVSASQSGVSGCGGTLASQNMLLKVLFV